MPDAVPPASQPSREPRLHHDPLSTRAVFVAPDRAGRPHDHGRPASLESCPFCAGHESRTPDAILRMPADERIPWRARIVPNLYPCVAHRPDAAGAAPPSARGVHEVLVESPTHLRSVTDVEPDAWRDAWQLCRARLAALAVEPGLAWATVFKNSGPRAGASLEHLHSQIVGLDFVPPTVIHELDAFAASPAAFAVLLAEAVRDGRVVAEEADVVALVPPAPRQPFETWILPRSPEPFFHATSPARVAAVAELTRLFVGRLGRLVPGAEFNWWLHQHPFDARTPSAAGWHWHLEILPRLSQFAGFELGTGCHITTLAPDESARLLAGP